MSGERGAAVAVLVIGAIALLLLIGFSGENPARVLMLVVQGGFLNANGVADAVVRAIPLCLVGLGITIAFKANVFNIGGDGQFIIGASVALAFAELASQLPQPLGLLILLAAGMAGGAFWAGIAGVLRARFGANEIIATILLNYVAIHTVSFLIRGPLQENAGIFPRTERLPPALSLDNLIEGTRISSALIVVVVAVIAVWLIVSRSRFGFELQAIGDNRDAALAGGVYPGAVIIAVMALSGALVGLAGISEISGVHGRLQEGVGAGLGTTGIAVALLARLNPLLVPVSAFAFSGLYVGSATVARVTAVPFPLVNIIEASIIFAFLATTALQRRKAS